MKKKVFYTELSYVLGLIIMAFGAAFTEKSNFGMSMVVAPAYILHLKVSEFLPWFTFGVAEYVFQGFLIVLTVVIVRRFKLSYLFSFVTAVLYGTLLDCISVVLSIVMSFAFFGFGVFNGVGVGTVLCALVNGFLIGRFSKLLEKHFDFKNKFKIQKCFE